MYRELVRTAVLGSDQALTKAKVLKDMRPDLVTLFKGVRDEHKITIEDHNVIWAEVGEGIFYRNTSSRSHTVCVCD